MKNIKKKILSVVMVFSLLAGVLSMPAQAGAKDTYWLVGVSKAAGGYMKMYYKGNKIALKGKVKKAASQDKIDDVKDKKVSYNLKVADNCKVTFVEAENTYTMTYKKWAKDNRYKKGDPVSCIAADIKVEGKKITRIYFGA